MARIILREGLEARGAKILRDKIKKSPNGEAPFGIIPQGVAWHCQAGGISPLARPHYPRILAALDARQSSLGEALAMLSSVIGVAAYLLAEVTLRAGSLVPRSHRSYPLDHSTCHD